MRTMSCSTSRLIRGLPGPRRAFKPSNLLAEKGGWNLLHTWWLADVMNPAVHFALSGAGPADWFGWPDVPQLEKLISNWVRESDQTNRKQLTEEIQKAALSEVTYVPWGEWVQPTAFRKNVRDVLQFVAPTATRPPRGKMTPSCTWQCRPFATQKSPQRFE